MKKWIISGAIAVMVIATLSNCKEKTETKVLTKEVTFKKEAEVTILKKETDSLITKLDIEISDDEYERQTGLMYRKSMEDKHGMLFIFDDEVTRSFYMKNTEFSIDIIYLNSDKEIVSIAKNAKPLDPTSLPSEGPAQYVLEVNAGLSDSWGLEAGDSVVW